MRNIWNNGIDGRSIFAWATAGLLFLLPWQTRLIVDVIPLAGELSSFGVLSVHATEVLVFLLGLWALILYRGELVEKVRGLWFASGLLCVSILLSALFSGWTALSWFHVLHIASAGVLFGVIVVQSAYMKRFIVAFAVGLVVPVVIGAVQVATGYFPSSTLFGIAERMADRPGDTVVMINGERTLRAYGSFPHPNIFGGYLSAAILLLVGVLRARRIEKEAGAYVAIVVLIGILGIGLALAMSKSAVLGLAVGLGVGLLASTTRLARGWRKWGAIGTGLIAILFVAALAVAPRFTGSSLESDSFGERIEQWRAYPEVISNVLVGSGPNSYPFLWHAVNPGMDWWLYQPIHNVIALVFAEIGLIGALALVYWIYCIDKRNYSALPHPLAIGALMAGASLFVIAMFDHYLWSLWPGLALAGIVMAFTWVSGENRE